MTATSGSHAAGLCLGVAGTALEGVSGDLHVVLERPGGALLSVIDGLGHGEPAAKAAQAAEDVLRAYAASPLLELLQHCHDSLRTTRGAVMSVAAIDFAQQLLEWAGVGNVETALLRSGDESRRSDAALILNGGVIGHRIPRINVSRVPISPGDLLIFATDGIRSGFTEGLDRAAEPQWLAEWILRRFGKSSDDALVLVVRYVGTTP